MGRVRFTRDNTAVLLIDHQVGLFTGVRDIDVNELKHNVVGLARAARALDLPIVAATTARDSMWGPTIPELKEALGDSDILDRSTVNAWDDERFVAQVENTGRDHLIIAGLSFEVCASLPAISAREKGFHPVVAVDACGTFSHHKREAGLARLITLGIEVSDYATMMVEIMADNADPKANAVYAALDMPFATLMGQVASALVQWANPQWTKADWSSSAPVASRAAIGSYQPARPAFSPVLHPKAGVCRKTQR